jgi:hypothetical protein
MLPLTGAELSVVMLSLRAFKFYLNSVEFYGQCQVVISQSGVGMRSSSLLFWLSANMAQETAASLQTIKKGDRNRNIKQIPEFEKTPRHRIAGTWRLWSYELHMCQIRCHH